MKRGESFVPKIIVYPYNFQRGRERERERAYATLSIKHFTMHRSFDFRLERYEKKLPKFFEIISIKLKFSRVDSLSKKISIFFENFYPKLVKTIFHSKNYEPTYEFILLAFMQMVFKTTLLPMEHTFIFDYIYFK